MSEDNTRAVIEALLFASDKPLTLERIKAVLDNLETTEIRKILEELNSEYAKSNRGMRITEIAGGFQMIAAPAFSSFLKKLYKGRRVERFSQAALETLAIIAYKQPVTKREVEAIRNVNVDGVIKNLLEKDGIRVTGRKKAPGRPKVYGTTLQFLEFFGLKSLEELPKVENFPAALTPKNITETKPTEDLAKEV
jgi:segregation and condensation protein B